MCINIFSSEKYVYVESCRLEVLKSTKYAMASSLVDCSSPSLRGVLERVPRCSRLRSSLGMLEPVLMQRGRLQMLRTRQGS